MSDEQKGAGWNVVLFEHRARKVGKKGSSAQKYGKQLETAEKREGKKGGEGPWFEARRCELQM
jgi:hypothetical protein